MQLNVEQKKIIESKPSGHILVKGVAGSGKTTVAVNKIPLLLNNYCHGKDDKVLMVTYNKSLTKYVEYIYNRIQEERDAEQLDLFIDDSKDKLFITTIDAMMFKYFVNYKKNNKNFKLEIASTKECQNILLEAMTSVNKLYPKVNAISNKNYSFVKEEIMWIKSCHYLELEEYQNIDRLGRVSKKTGDVPQKLRKNSDTRAAIFKVMELYNERLKEINKIDFQDMSLLALNEIKKRKLDGFTHILIDESQDLTRVQLEFIKELYNEKEYSSITFVADIAQSIYSQSWLVKGRSFATIGFDMKGKSTSLSKNYRTTTQIAMAAYSLIEKDIEIIHDDNFVKPSLIDKQGAIPVYRNFKSKEDEGRYIAKAIKEHLSKDYSLKDIVIISRRKDQLQEISKYLKEGNIPYDIFEARDEFDFNKESVKLVTLHSIKGLEFKVVWICGLNNKVMPMLNTAKEFDEPDVIESRERKLLYVGMTRATEQLFITSDGRPSKFINDISYKALKIDINSRFRRVHRIDIEEYKFKNKILDLYSEEEKIRQWIVAELNEVYKYPLDLISIEQPINIGSKLGYVDAAVSIYKNSSKTPYIFIEAKKWGYGVDRSIHQLKSYMANSQTVQYGIATDGNEIILINKDGEIIEDIPMFNSNMMPSTLENFEYIDLRHKTTMNITRDINAPKEVYTIEDGKETLEEEIYPIPVFNEIAAGKPIFINDIRKATFYMPRRASKDMSGLFMLKIKGESMINKNIHDGDLILINKQNSANIGDIVAVDIDGNATLKTYKTMGGKILLVPENDDYEPMLLEEEQVNIIGVATGIIKEKN